MHLLITCDSNQETMVGEVITHINGSTRKLFVEKSYGLSVEGVVIVFMCRDPKLAFKQRIRFSKKDKTLYADIMLNYESMIPTIDNNQRFILMKEKLINEIPIIIKKYKFKDFNLNTFISDLKQFLQFNTRSN